MGDSAERTNTGAWWKAKQTAVLHYRPRMPAGWVGNTAVCGRVVRWVEHVEPAPRTERCGYCSYRLARVEGTHA